MSEVKWNAEMNDGTKIEVVSDGKLHTVTIVSGNIPAEWEIRGKIDERSINYSDITIPENTVFKFVKCCNNEGTVRVYGFRDKNDLLEDLKSRVSIRNQMGGSLYWNILNDECCTIANDYVAVGGDWNTASEVMGKGTHVYGY